MNSIKLTFPVENELQAEIILATLCNLTLDGAEQTDSALIIYLPEIHFNESQIKEALGSEQCNFEVETIQAQNWNALWESNFEPIQINNDIGVRAHFHPSFENCTYEIVITPKMSFGTGHHETTQMMLSFINELNIKDKKVLDFGCGTGVLAILAKMKGASNTIGIDNDPWCIENAKENCIVNHCEDILICDTSLSSLHDKFDIILANINLNVLLNSMPTLKKLLTSNGTLILSGILVTDLPIMTETLKSHSFEIVGEKIKNTWASIHAKLYNM